MAGKRKQTHWAVRRKDKKARGDGGEDRHQEKERVDRRAGFPEAIHPGSYAALRPPVAGGDAEAKDNNDSLPPKRRFGIWLAFCGKKYSGMQMYVSCYGFCGCGAREIHDLMACRNEGVKTIEAELERALFEAGGISHSNYGFLQKVYANLLGPSVRYDRLNALWCRLVGAELLVPIRACMLQVNC